MLLFLVEETGKDPQAFAASQSAADIESQAISRTELFVVRSGSGTKFAIVMTRESLERYHAMVRTFRASHQHDDLFSKIADFRAAQWKTWATAHPRMAALPGARAAWLGGNALLAHIAPFDNYLDLFNTPMVARYVLRAVSPGIYEGQGSTLHQVPSDQFLQETP